jgi:glutathione S-transferase
MSARLYVILGSHACRTGMLLLEHKRVPYRTVTLPSGMHPMFLRFAGFGGSAEPIRPVDGKTRTTVAMADKIGTVPALHIDDDRVQTNTAIARYLDEVRPERPLFPADADERREVEEAEEWGDQVLQMVARRVVLAAGRRGEHVGDEGRLGPLLMKSRIARRGVVEVAGRFFAADEEAEQAMLAELPAHLDRVDAWVGAGVLDGDDLNAADYMIVTSLALLCYCPDLAPQVQGRPAGRLVERVFGY